MPQRDAHGVGGYVERVPQFGQDGRHFGDGEGVRVVFCHGVDDGADCARAVREEEEVAEGRDQAGVGGWVVGGFGARDEEERVEEVGGAAAVGGVGDAEVFVGGEGGYFEEGLVGGSCGGGVGRG